MPLDTAKATMKTVAITEAFDAIGVAEPTRQPRSRRNNEPIAWEFFVATQLARLADARKRQAHEAAVNAGVLPDHEKEPLPEGAERSVYAGEVVTIALAVGVPVRRLDVKSFVKDLEKAGVARKLLDKLVEDNMVAARAPHKFTAALTTA